MTTATMSVSKKCWKWGGVVATLTIFFFCLFYLLFECLYHVLAVLDSLTQVMNLQLDLLVSTAYGGQGLLLHILI